MSPAPRSGGRRPSAAAIRAAKASDGKQQHLDWLNLVEVSGPFLTLPVLLRTWPQLEGVPSERRADIRLHHGIWQDDRKGAGRLDWIGFLLRTLLEWDDALHLREGAGRFGDSGESLAEDDALLDRFAVSPPGADTTVRPDFALVRPGADPAAEPDTAAAAKHVPILGLVLPHDTVPTRRIKGDSWSASGVDRLAHVLRHHGVELGLVTDGRWWSLVWAPPGGVTTSATFDTIAWNEKADLVAVRAWVSLLRRGRFFGRPEDELLPALLRESLEGQEDVTEALGIQVRQAVELLVDSIGRAEARMVKRGGKGLSGVPASEVYRGAVAVMMRVVFLLFAEERGLLPADNELYAEAYSAGRLYETLDKRRRADGEDSLEHTTAAWHRLIALFHAVHGGVDHPLLTLPAYDGSIFDPKRFPWLEAVPQGADGTDDDAARAADGHTSLLPIDDRTVLHVLDSVQFVVVNRERRRLTFRALDVEQIGYVYEGLLSYDGKRAQDTVLGLVGKPGLEHEVSLTELEELAAPFGVGTRAVPGQKPNLPGLAKKLYEHFKEPEPPATASRLEKLLAPGDEQARGKALHRLLAVTENDRELAERILPFHGLLRDDLRSLPVVIPEDGLYVTESHLRKDTGTHYTPRALAQQVAEGALEPLVYLPGPLQTADDKQWKLIKPDEILKLKVADIAMGSAAFLVAACRYLADRLVDAWVEEGDEEALAFRGSHRDQAGAVMAADAESDRVMIRARRLIIEHCLYGVDINPMAVEMAKLSLWLISMDPERPFTFLDDRLVAGDSLLGITSLEQLEVMDLDARRGRDRHKRGVIDFTAGVRELVHELAEDRKQIGDMPGETLKDIAEKRAILADVQERATRVNLLADLTAGAALASHGSGPLPARESLKKEMARNGWSLKRSEAPMAAAGMGFAVAKGLEGATEEARALAHEWLATDLPEGGFERKPVHWPLVFPEVFEGGGFDAVIGNPPFLGGTKISGPMGSAYRKYIAASIAGFETDRADLVSFFVRQAGNISRENGKLAYVATHAVAKGTSKEVGLDALESTGWTLYGAHTQKPWPSKSASVYIVKFWLSNGPWNGRRLLNETPTPSISTALAPASRSNWNPVRLSANLNIGLQGSKPSAKGFILTQEERLYLLNEDPRNIDVVRPYLTGSDLYSDPNCAPRRWIVNFKDWGEEIAKSYPKPFQIIKTRVPAERIGSSEEDNESWWQFGRPAIELYRRLEGKATAIAFAETSKTLTPVLVPTDYTFGNTVVVLPISDIGTFTVLASAFHYWWSLEFGVPLKNDPRYQIPRCFETFPRPDKEQLVNLSAVGENLSGYRRRLTAGRGIGLTGLYNLVHNPECHEEDIAELRAIHRSLDEATARAYGWDDLLDAPGRLDHGFHETDQGTRYTIGLVVRTEIIDRLRELNHERYAAEVAAGLHKGKSGSKGKRTQGSAKMTHREEIPGTEEGDPAQGFGDNGLFPPQDALF